MSEMCRSDAAYVLGALSPVDRRAYEDHLRVCADCQAAVQRLAGLPGLLALTTAEAIDETGPRPPATLLPSLIARAHAARRRRSRVTGGVLVAAVAALLAVVGTLVVTEPSETASRGPTAPAASTSSAVASTQPAVTKAMTQVLPGPMTASLELVDKRWGTAITVICEYTDQVETSVAYDLTVIDTDGHPGTAGTWRAVPGATARVSTATAVPRDRIASLEVRLPDGRTILRSSP